MTDTALKGLLGLDVGFSATKPTSGVAVLVGTTCRVGRTTAESSSRMQLLHGLSQAAVTAIDAPLLPELDSHIRLCERVVASGSFQNRCKAGFSHAPGTGHELRRAGFESAGQFRDLTSRGGGQAAFPRVFAESKTVEAFPNAFLGVCLSDDAYARMPALRRGQRFDWLYDMWCNSRLFAQLTGVLAEALRSHSPRSVRQPSTTNTELR